MKSGQTIGHYKILGPLGKDGIFDVRADGRRFVVVQQVDE